MPREYPGPRLYSNGSVQIRTHGGHICATDRYTLRALIPLCPREVTVHSVPFVVQLTVWVPLMARSLSTWQPCEVLAPLLGEEPVRSCDELVAVFGAQGRLVARLLSAPQAPRYSGFRIIGRDRDSGELLGTVEWQRSRETRQFIAADVWTACQWTHARPFPASA